MIDEKKYKMGRQPCANFKPSEEYPLGDGNVHCCTHCESLVSFCEECRLDHHFEGYDTCTGRMSEWTKDAED